MRKLKNAENFRGGSCWGMAGAFAFALISPALGPAGIPAGLGAIYAMTREAKTCHL